jgi:hypothetical protein
MRDLHELGNEETVNLLFRLRRLESGRRLAHDQKSVVGGEGMAFTLRSFHEGAHRSTFEHFIRGESGLVDPARFESSNHLGMLHLKAIPQAIGHRLGDFRKQKLGTKQENVLFVTGTAELNGAEERSCARSRVLVLKDESTVSLFGLQVWPRFKERRFSSPPASQERYTPGDPRSMS